MPGPELIVGLVGPVGCDISLVEQELTKAFKAMDYAVNNISLSSSIDELLSLKEKREIKSISIEEKIDNGNEVRKKYDENGILAVAAIEKIRNYRSEINKISRVIIPDGMDSFSKPIDSTCHIVRQLKRPEEVDLLERVYGKQFIQVSIVQGRASRISNIVQRIRRENPGFTDTDVENKSRDIIDRDEHEAKEDFGQRISDIFYQGDVFIDSSEENNVNSTTVRFVEAFFGKNSISPKKDEFGSYMAKAASLRSVDLSRQVGAALLSNEGDLIALGCNDVPKPKGGLYWHDDTQKARDIDKRGEANKEETRRIIHNFLKILSDQKLIKGDLKPEEILANDDNRSAINESMIGDITEYGRMVHAEMSAITDAARLGISTRNATLYVTTYPCHNCAKHIIAAGISRVIYIEPYPKSRAPFLYVDAISEDTIDDSKVKFSHFVGISPKRYRDIFEKGKRRRKNGDIDDWYQGRCTPRTGNVVLNYTANEAEAILGSAFYSTIKED